MIEQAQGLDVLHLEADRTLIAAVQDESIVPAVGFPLPDLHEGTVLPVLRFQVDAPQSVRAVLEQRQRPLDARAVGAGEGAGVGRRCF